MPAWTCTQLGSVHNSVTAAYDLPQACLPSCGEPVWMHERNEKKAKEKKQKEKGGGNCAFWCHSNEKPSIIPGCPGWMHDQTV